MTRKKAVTSTREVPKAVEDMHALLQWIVPLLDKMPRNRRYTLATRIEEGFLFVLERLLEAAYSSNRQASLRAANLRLEVVRHLWRLCLELRAVSRSGWSHGAGQMLELGRQIGGWQKASAQ